MVTPGYGVNLPSLSTQLIQDSVVRQRRFEFEFEIGVNKNDQRDAVGFWGQKKSGFNKQNIKFLVGLIILMMVKLVLVLVAAIFEAAQHSVLKALIIVICLFFQIQQKINSKFLRGLLAWWLSAICLFLASLPYYLIALIMSSTNLCCTKIDHFKNKVI